MNIFSSSWLKSGLYSIGSRLSLLVFGFGSFFFLVRSQSQADFGAWSLFLTITTILEMSRNGLVQNALIKLYHSEATNQDKVISASWLINSGFTLLVYGLLVLLSFFVESLFGMAELKYMFLWYGITLALLVPLTQYNYIQQAHLSFGGIFWASFIRQGLLFSFIVSAFAFKQSLNLLDLVRCQIICTAIAAGASYWLAKSFLSYRFTLDKLVIKQVFRFGKYVMGTNLASLIFKSADQFSIGYLLNPASVAIYSSAMRISNLIEYPVTAITEVMYPHSASRISTEGQHVVKSLYEKSVGLTLAMVLPVVLGVFFFSDWIITIIAGVPYAEAAPILRITILFGLLTPFNRQFGMAMDASGRPRINFYVLLVAACFNIILNIIFVMYNGLPGAAYATLIGYLIVSVVGHVILQNLFNVELKNVFIYSFSVYSQIFRKAKSLTYK
ncbi:MAG: flippase [Cyclobacteriaceae bacterium]|nr:flippase [Cyclobacteriaceae bacterium]